MKTLAEHIVKLKNGQYRLLSKKGKNLGTFDSHAAAAKHEEEVEYFKTHESHRINTFGHFITESVFPAKESQYWSQLRRQRKVYTKIVRVDARKLRAAYIKSQGSFATNLRDVKLQNIRDIIDRGEDIDSYPNVAIMPNGRVDVADGRHRLAIAAERGMQIDIGVEKSVSDAMLAAFR